MSENRIDGKIEARKEVLSPEIRYAIQQAAVIASVRCKCKFNASQKDTLKHLDGMCGDLGDGNPSMGMEKIRETTKYVGAVMNYGKDAKKYTWKILVTGIVGWLLYTIGSAIKSLLNK